MNYSLSSQTLEDDCPPLDLLSYSSFPAQDRLCEIRIANTLELREESFRLMYEVYSAQNYGQPHPCEMWFSLHELLPSSITVVVTHAEEVVGTVTLCCDTSIGIPADDAFGEELKYLRGGGEKIAEVFSLGIRPDFRCSEVVLGKLVSSVYSIARFLAGATYLMVTVIPPHAAFYRRKLLFEQLGNQGFHKKTGVACVLLAHPIDTFDQLNEDQKKRVLNSFNAPAKVEMTECCRLKDMVRPISPDEIEYFLRIRPEILENADREERFYLNSLLKDYAA